MAGRFSVEAIFRAVDRMSAPVSKMQNRVGRFTRSMNRGLNRVSRTVDRVNGGLKQSAVVASGALLITGGAMADVITTGAKFEKSITSAVAKFPGEITKGSQAFVALEDVAKRVGKSTEFSASQSAEALTFLAMAGLDADQAIKALPKVVDLATASNLDLARSTDIATDTLGAMGLMTKDSTQLMKNMARVNDVLAKTVTSSNTDMEQLFETIKDGGPIATSSGASIETFAALAGTLANAGIKGSKAGTTLKNVFLKLSAATPAASKMLKRLGIQTKDSQGNMLDIVDIIGQLEKNLKGLGSADRAAALNEIFGKIPIAGVNVLLKAGADELRRYRGEINSADGASKTMAATMRDNVAGSFDSLLSAIEGVKISIFSMNNEGIKTTIDRMTEWVRANEELIAQNVGEFLKGIVDNIDEIIQTSRQIAGIITLWVGLTGVIKLARAATIAYSVAVGLVTGAYKIFKLFILGIPKALAALRTAVLLLNLAFALNPVGLVIAAIGILIGLGATLILYWEPVKKWFSDLWGSIAAEATKAMNVVKGATDFFGFGDDDEESKDIVTGGDGSNTGSQGSRQLVSPAERVSRSIEEKRETNNSELTIKDETGLAEITKGFLGQGLTLESSGAF